MKTNPFLIGLSLAQLSFLSAANPGAAADAPATATNSPPSVATPAGPAPRIQFSETSFNFDKVVPTDSPKHDFIFTNTGQAVLEITAVRPGCGCTTAGAWTHQVEPGGVGKIPLSFDPSHFNGPVSKSATVVCNDPTQHAIQLQFQATVWKPIDLQPGQLFFVAASNAPSETKVIKIVNNAEDPVTLEPPVSSNPNFTTDLKTVRPGKEFELRITCPPNLGNATQQGDVTIKTSNAKYPLLKAPIFRMARAVMPPVASPPAAAAK